jgi:hypothetical protein
LFGLISARAESGMPQLAHARLEPFQELAAVVAEQPAGGSPPVEIEMHRTLVADVFAHCAILPAPPGIVFRSIGVLRRWLELHHAALLDGLAYVEGRAEARVHVRRASAPAADQLAHGAVDADRDAAVLESVATQIFHELGREQPAWVPSTSATGAGGTGVVGAAARAAAPLTRDAGEVSASFLVERSRWRAFVEAVALERQRDPRLDVRMTGPWPPYDFVRLQFGG